MNHATPRIPHDPATSHLDIPARIDDAGGHPTARPHASRRRIATPLAGYAAALALALCLPGFAHAGTFGSCSQGMLKGRYVFTGSGFTRAPASPPGTPWAPKAILEVLQFNGDGTVQTPALTAANPFGDTGGIVQPPVGAPGQYTVNADCTGSVQFFDPSGVAFSIHVESFGGTIRMIQTNPSNNVFEGTARRSW